MDGDSAGGHGFQPSGLVFDKLVSHHFPGRGASHALDDFGGDAAGTVHERFSDQSIRMRCYKTITSGCFCG
jgi:hypothetical protein